MNLNENERKVLTALADLCEPGESACGFSLIENEIGIGRKAIRRACRSLARKGLTEYKRALWTEDGEPAGAGYGPTRAGAEIAKDLPRPQAQSRRCVRGSWDGGAAAGGAGDRGRGDHGE